MAKPEFIARQSAYPTGLFGHLVARIMALDTARVNRRVLERLEPKPGERILEVGCGHGRALRTVAAHVAPGLAAGIDPSQVMRSVARRHLRHAITSGHARIDAGDAAKVPHPDRAFDKVFTVHTLYFWPDLEAGFRELRRVLCDQGLLLLAFHDGADARLAEELPTSVYTLRTAGEIEASLRAAGFHAVGSERDAKTGITLAVAHR